MADGQDYIVDPRTGLYNPYEVRHSPGPGGPGGYLGGVLSFLNAFKGQDLANQAQASRDVQQMHAVQQLQPMDYEQVPGMADITGTATGLGPEGSSAMAQQNPAMLFRNKVGQLQEQYPEGIPPEVLDEAALSTGQNQLYRGITSGSNTQAKNFSATLQKQYQASLASADTDREARRKTADLLLTGYPQYAAALEAFVSNGTDEPTPYAAARTKTTEQRGTAAEAAGQAATARAAYLQAVTEPTIKEKLARAGLLEAQTDLARAHKQIEDIKAANGGVLPEAQKPRYLALLTQIEGKIQTAAAMEGLGIKPDPAVKKDLLAALADVKAQLSGTAAAPAKKQTYDPATDSFK